MSEKEDAEIMTPYEDYSVEELKEAYRRLFFLSDLNDADLAELEQILAVLREKDPLPPSRSVDEAWADFQRYYRDAPVDIDIQEIEDVEEVVKAEPKSDVVVDAPSTKAPRSVPANSSRKLIRVSLIAAAVIALMVAITLAANAFGLNLWGWVPKWNNEVMSFESETTEKPYFEHVPDVLKRLEITEPLYPTWLPADFVQTDLKITEKPLFIHEIFEGVGRKLIITISPTSGSETTIYQKTENKPVEYVTGNTLHYIFDNTTELIAVWNIEDYTTVIAGNISIEEMELVIDSVYEVK